MAMSFFCSITAPPNVVCVLRAHTFVSNLVKISHFI